MSAYDQKKDYKDIMLTNPDIYIKKMTSGEMYAYVSKQYKNEEHLTQNMLDACITDGFVETKYEIDVAYEDLCGLNDWPEGEGFGSSDRFHYLKSARESVESARKHNNEVLK